MTNKEIKRIQSLKRGKCRREHGQFLIEGKRLVQSAFERKIKPDLIYFTESFHRENTEWIQSIEWSGVSYENISTKQLEKISFTKSPSGILAICKFPEKHLPDLNQNRWVYLDRISDPGNMGTILRSAAWFGLNHVALSADCVDPFNPKAVRAGMGAHFHLAIHSDIDINIFIENQYYIVGADHHGQPLTELLVIPERWVLVLGGEAHGLSEATNKKLDRTLSIPKSGSGESLNVSVAGAILMHQLSSK